MSPYFILDLDLAWSLATVECKPPSSQITKIPAETPYESSICCLLITSMDHARVLLSY